MSVIYEENDCKLITHQRQSHSYETVDGSIVQYRLKEILFENFKRKQKEKKQATDEANEMKSRVENFMASCKAKNLFSFTEDSEIDFLKTANINLTNSFYASESNFGYFHGENNMSHGKVITMNGNTFLIPPNCRFFNKKVDDIETCLLPNEVNKFDFIVIDPPWCNRYIKRVKKTTGNKQGYTMMSNDEIMQIPIEKYTKQSTIVVIWSTNSDTHIKAIKENLIRKWNLKLISTWQWVKLDKNGELFCPIDGNKKPFEQILIATHHENTTFERGLEKDILIFSQPSAIHSHKPPLLGESWHLEIMQNHLNQINYRRSPKISAAKAQMLGNFREKSLRKLHIDWLGGHETSKFDSPRNCVVKNALIKRDKHAPCRSSQSCDKLERPRMRIVALNLAGCGDVVCDVALCSSYAREAL